MSVFLMFVLCFMRPVDVNAGTSPGIPLNSRIYDYLERLEVSGLIATGITSTRPFSRSEGRRLTNKAIQTWDSLSDAKKEKMQDIRFMLDELDREFSEFRDDHISPVYFKTVSSGYIRYIYSDEQPDYFNDNNNGDLIRDGHNIRAGFSSDLRLWNSVSFYLNPEFRVSDDSTYGKVVNGYGILNMRNVELFVGREPMWWGPGYHGSLLLTDNARPFDMIRLTSQSPFVLPWIFSGVGQLKPTLFVTQLENDRDYPNAKLMGMRLDFRPVSSFRFALSRVIMFGGEGRKGLTLSDWFNILIANDNTEHSWTGSDIDNNQIISLDFSFFVNDLDRTLPFEGMKIYGEVGAEDSSGNGWPKEKAFLAGVFVEEPLKIEDVNLRIEWATTAVNSKYDAWYTHGVYTDGYTYKDRIIGHHMGADAEDIFARVEYFHNRRVRIGLETDFERRGVHADPTDKRTWTGVDLMYRMKKDVDVNAGYGIEDVNDASNLLWMKIGYRL